MSLTRQDDGAWRCPRKSSFSMLQRNPEVSQSRLRLASVALTLGMAAGWPDISRVGEAPPGCRRRACLPQLVTAIAEAAPAATALHAGSARMTYGELIARAN